MLADGARCRPPHDRAGRRRPDHFDVIRTRPARPSGRLYGLLRGEIRRRRPYARARLRVGADGNYRQRDRADGVSVALDRQDVRRRRSRQAGSVGISCARAQGAPWRARGPRRAVAVPRLESFGLLHRPHALRRWWLYGRVTCMARIAIIGGGLMGHGIAQVFACAGHQVRITDPNAAARERILRRIGDNLRDLDGDLAALANIQVCDALEGAVADADWTIEAALEDLPLKQELFVAIERAAPRHAILASNTSVIPITAVMARVENKARALGTHWWNPPYLVPLVEVIRTAWTSDASVETTLSLLQSVGKQPVEVKKDVA